MNESPIALIAFLLEVLQGKGSYEILAVKPVTKRGGSLQVTIPPEIVKGLDLNDPKRKLAFVKLETEKGMFYLIMKPRFI